MVHKTLQCCCGRDVQIYTYLKQQIDDKFATDRTDKILVSDMENNYDYPNMCKKFFNTFHIKTCCAIWINNYIDPLAENYSFDKKIKSI